LTLWKWATPALIAAGLTVGVVLPVLVAWRTGSLSIPHSDAWSYSLIGQTFARTGHMRLVGWGRFFLIGQFVVLGPFARSLLVQQLFVAGLAAVGLVATFDLLRPFTGPTRAAVAVLTLSLWPGFGLLATSFMGEVPAFAGALACLAIGQRAIRSLSVPVLVSAAVVGLWAMTTREQAVIAPISVLLVFASAARRRSLRALLSTVGTGVVFAGLACVLEKCACLG
jgi:hypothetical protein